MNRIMRRPMFRKGGSAGEGITSGLQTRLSRKQEQLNKMIYLK